MRKNSRDGQGYEHQGSEHHSVQYASGDDPSAAREATEQIEPANDHHGHTHDADDCCLVSNERRIPEDGLHHSGQISTKVPAPKYIRPFIAVYFDVIA